MSEGAQQWRAWVTHPIRGARLRGEFDAPLDETQLAALAKLGIDDEVSADPGRYTAVHAEPEVTVEGPVDHTWAVVVTFTAQDGAPVVGGVEVRPRRPTWDAPQRPEIPRGGLTTSVLRSVTFGKALALARQSLREVDGDTLAWHGFRGDALDTTRRPSKGYPDRFYARIADIYVDEIDKGGARGVRSRVAERMTHETGAPYTSEYVRDALGVARDRRLLTKPKHGAAEGELTEKGRKALGA